MIPIQRREWFFPALLALLFIVVGSFPYLYGMARAESGETFMGFVGRGTPGANSYLAFARQVAEGRHGVTNLYTPEAPAGTYINPEWWLMGQAARISGMSLLAVFHVGRCVSVVAFLFAVYYLGAVGLRTSNARRWFLFLVACGTGLGWIVYGLNALSGANLTLPLDARGVNLFGYLMNKPHFVRAGFFAALQYAWLIRADQTGKTGYFALSGLAAAGHSVVRPYHIPEALLVLVIYGVLRTWGQPMALRGVWMGIAVSAGCHLPAICWHGLVYLKNPLGLSGMDSWTPVFLLFQMLWLGAPFALLVIYTLGAFLRGRSRAITAVPVPAIWLLSALLLLHAYPYFPWGVESYFPWVLASPLLFLHYVVPRLEAIRRLLGLPRACRLWAGAGLVLLVLPGSLLTYGKFFVDLRHPDSPWRYYLDYGSQNAVAWLAAQGGDEPVLLASHDTSQFVPRLGDVRVVTGQDVLSRDYRLRNGWVRRFYQSPGDWGFKRWLCRELGVTHVLYGPAERASGAPDLANVDWLEAVYTGDGVTVYAVGGGSAPGRSGASGFETGDLPNGHENAH